MTCAHHWLIESPAGPTSTGVCKLCGAVRDFKTWVELNSYGYTFGDVPVYSKEFHEFVRQPMVSYRGR